MDSETEREIAKLEREIGLFGERERVMTNFTGPRVGGGTDYATVWVGGSNVPEQKRSKPTSINARRPQAFRDAEKISISCTQGLKEDHKLGLDTEAAYSVTFTSWVSAIRGYLEERGMDTVFRIYNSDANTEQNLLIDWGAASRPAITKWVGMLNAGLKDKDGSQLDICEFDQENLKWSGTSLKNSISLKLWQTIEKDVLFGASGPEVFGAIVDKVQQVCASAVRSLTNTLEGMSITTVVRQDVDEFSRMITEIATRIDGTGAAPGDLNVIVAKTFLHADNKMFDSTAVKLWNLADEGGNMHWRDIIGELTQKYRRLAGQNLWGPAAKTKQQSAIEADIASMKGTLNALAQQSNGGNRNSGGGSNSSNVTCFGCGQQGHMKRNCPNPNSTGSNPQWAAPQSGASEKKTVNGSVYQYCGKCRQGKGYWNKGDSMHSTAEHRGRPPPTGEGGGTPGAAAPAPAPAPAPATATANRLEGGVTFVPEGGLRFAGVAGMGSLFQLSERAQMVPGEAPDEEQSVPMVPDEGQPTGPEWVRFLNTDDHEDELEETEDMFHDCCDDFHLN